MFRSLQRTSPKGSLLGRRPRKGILKSPQAVSMPFHDRFPPYAIQIIFGVSWFIRCMLQQSAQHSHRLSPYSLRICFEAVLSFMYSLPLFPTIKHPPTVPAGGRCHLSTWSLLLSGFNLPVACDDNQQSEYNQDERYSQSKYRAEMGGRWVRRGIRHNWCCLTDRGI